MTNKELGEKIEEAAYLLRVCREGPMTSMGPSREQAQEDLGKIVRELLIEGVRGFMDAPIERTAPSAGSDHG